jgi:Protein of unknown function (DUF551)
MNIKWIKVSERAPEIRKYVLVYTDEKELHIAYYYDENEHERNAALTRKDKYPVKLVWQSIPWLHGTVTHWAELPKGPV